MRAPSLGLLAVLALASCKSEPKPPSPQQPTVGSGEDNAPIDGGVGAVSGSGSGSGSGRDPRASKPPDYRVTADDAKPPIDPTLSASGKSFMVVAEGAAATKVGHAILSQGGNAVDAAVAVGFAMAVVHPTAGNIGGGGFAIVRLAPGKFAALDFRETAPAAATATMYLDANGNVTKDSVLGQKAAGVPGTVAGLWALHEKHGSMKWKDLVAPAIALARDGFAVDEVTGKAATMLADRIAKFPSSAAIWLPNGKPVAQHDIVKIPDLAATLERIAELGPDGFYKGKTAELIVAEMQRGNGIMTAADLAGYKAEWRDPLAFSYRGHTVVSMPPPSSGGIVLAMTANILSRVELGKLPWHGIEHVRWVVEAWRRGFAARNELLGDPSFVKNPTEKLMSKAYADTLAKTITDKATPSADMASLVDGMHTTNYSIVDGKGMAVALTTTVNTSFGSCATVAGAGFLLNNEMDDFASKPGSPNLFGLVQGEANKIAPGKRMLSSMAPTIVETGDAKHELVLVLGGRGGPRIITAVWQVLSNVIDFKMPADAAVASARMHHQHLPDTVLFETKSIDEATGKDFAERGYKAHWGGTPREFASTTVILRTPNGWSGAADHRGGGAAMGD